MIKMCFKRAVCFLYRNLDMIAFCRSSGMQVGPGTRISASVNIGSEPYLTTVGSHCEITAQVSLINHDGGVWVFREKHPDWDVMGKIIIEDNVYIGYGAMILPNVKIGRDSVIGARSVVTKDVPAGSVVVGVPARVIKSVDEYYAKCKLSAINSKGRTGDEKRKFIESSFE